MLLSTLNRKEKLKFLDLALHMIFVDGNPSDLETRLLNMMLAEVGDNIIAEYHFERSDSLEETIQFFDVLDNKIQRIVYLNLIRISLSEEIYNTTEHEFLEMIRSRFHIKDDVKQALIREVYKEKDVRERISKIVGK
ncbi:MAG: hypothetical protein ACPGCR_04040 [Acholeplasmataceae bacterium]